MFFLRYHFFFSSDRFWSAHFFAFPRRKSDETQEKAVNKIFSFDLGMQIKPMFKDAVTYFEGRVWLELPVMSGFSATSAQSFGYIYLIVVFYIVMFYCLFLSLLTQ